uniref:RNA-directed DNA polymerase, eukaryota n=1 Tax=Tanacetum cinerariifolium TaxID=118510 RepID=A0A6L2J3R4_TANCI|nr:RNA-directed DNA polymerase, eukaryota [Tanacetum cinerariifolium]
MGSYRSKEDEVLKIATSVFVANVPDSFGAKDLWNTCKQYGQVLDVDRLVNNLCTMWVGRHKLQANIPRFQREHLKRYNSLHNIDGVKMGSQNSKMDLDSIPMMVMDDSCLNEKDYSLCLMGKVKDFATLANLKVVVANEGFDNIKFKYMGGRVTWVEIKGIPLKMWSKDTFNRVATKWGVLLDVDDQEDEYFHRKRIYFVEDNDNEEDSEVGSYEEVPNREDVKNAEDLEGDSDGEIVPDTKFEKDFPNQKGEEDSIGQGHFKKFEVPKSGGSILQLIDDLVKVRETIGVSVGNSGRILCVWDPNMFKKMNSTVLDYFVMVRGDWMPNGKKTSYYLGICSSRVSEKKMLWDYLSLVMSKCKGEVVIMGNFNEVRNKSKRYGTLFNRHGTNVFNRFISNAGLEEVPLEGCSSTWCHRSATKMSKLDRFLISDSLLCSCPNISSITLDRYLSDHRPILMREMYYDYGLVPFRFFHYWFEVDCFDKFIKDSWKDAPIIESNALVRMMKKLKYLKEKIRMWSKLNKEKSHKSKRSLLAKLADCDAIIDKGEGENNVVNRRTEVVNLLQEMEKKNFLEAAQKAKIKWAIEGDENSKYYQGVINKKRNQLSIRGILVEDTWIDSPSLAVWDCGIDKSPGPDGFTFGFYHRYWKLTENDVVDAILANRLILVLGGLVNEIQSDFMADKQILDGPFILNELVQWCKKKKKQSLVFKVDFKKAYDLVRWDQLDDIMRKFGFGEKWAKSKLVGISVKDDKVKQAAAKIGCNTLKTPFSYLGSKVGGCMSRIQSWNETIERIAFPMKVLHRMESMRSHFFNGAELSSKKSVWVKWKHTLASKDKGGLEVSSKTRWIKAVPIKVNVHAWKVKLDGLLTRLNISRRGIDIESILCPMCGKAVESTSHIFFTVSNV